LDVGGSLRLDIEGKYDRAVCVEQGNQGRTFAVTTSKHFERGEPTYEYVSTIRQGLADAPLTARVADQYLERLFAEGGVG
jgi:hypothetical protein